ncbi:putative FmdB family regulatory protein [Aquabacterium commune]|uniref:Putative FmdB family regulatory protein n=1 Tax=Aquabacterium commune TaxID=70586 RepID=A0A4R6RPM7_9BURK|nr:FmdB family zinc ribbon protein [Aquabacterium commune]TDP88165.1 putative FmdB family regulatory protein [Aquabacterium commune]
MPIYAYRCSACGHAKDALQKMSDAPLTTCPACGAEAFSKQVTAAGFQLKGSGWYVTDFRGGSGGASAPAAAPEGSAPEAAAAGTTATDTAKAATPAPAAASTDSGSGSGSSGTSSGGGASSTCH